MFIASATTVSDELFEASERLLPQLKYSFPTVSRADIVDLVSSSSSTLLFARYPTEHAEITGLLTLIIYRVPTGIRARVEDVVVDTRMRGKGIGEALIRYALSLARDAGANGVALTSNPRREAANRLYKKIGFNLWKTNLYLYEF